MSEINVKSDSVKIKELAEKLLEINAKEPEMVEAIVMLVNHIHGTYADKYAKGIEKGIDTKKQLYDPEGGKYVNQYQISRYLQRYITQGSRKSSLLIDLFKMCHYALFEVVRRIRTNDLDGNEPKV
jgi:hypothetical protein